MHAYIFLRAKAAFGFGWATGAPFLVLFVFLVSAPVLTRLLVRHDHESAARCIALIGFAWMGFLFFFVCLNLAVDIAAEIKRLLCWLGVEGSLPFALRGRSAFILLTVLTVAISFYSAFEAHNIRIVHVRIATDKLPPGAKNIRIAQISDLHLGLIHRNGRTRQVANLIAKQRPDIFVSTGDMVDGKFLDNELKHVKETVETLREIHAPMGKFAIIGNHEYYSGLSDSIAFMRNAGFTILQNEAVVADGAVRIVGISDSSSSRQEVGALESNADGHFTVLLKHRPEVDSASAGKFDLQLSGHSHQGQIFPFLLLVRRVYPYSGGTYALPEGGTLHVNRGTGTWGPPMRFLAPPEITIIDLEGQS